MAEENDEDRKKDIQEQKRIMPYIFVEYIKMCYAKDELDAARAKYKAAKTAWRQVGE